METGKHGFAAFDRRGHDHTVLLDPPQLARLEVRDWGPGPDEALQAKQARAMVLSALEKIPLRRRAVLVMHDLEQVPMRQVAATLSLPLFTAYSRLRKARTELEAALRRAAKDARTP